MKISKLATLVASLLAVGCLSSCGEQGGGSGALVINFWHTFGKTPADAVEAQAKRFQQLVKQQEGVDVEIKFTYKGGYTDMVGLVTKSFATSDNPTICVAYPDHVADYFAKGLFKHGPICYNETSSNMLRVWDDPRGRPSR